MSLLRRPVEHICNACTSCVVNSKHTRAMYNELLYAVSHKYPGESRHETALRYIRQAERGGDESGAKQNCVVQGTKC